MMLISTLIGKSLLSSLIYWDKLELWRDRPPTPHHTSQPPPELDPGSLPPWWPEGLLTSSWLTIPVGYWDGLKEREQHVTTHVVLEQGGGSRGSESKSLCSLKLVTSAWREAWGSLVSPYLLLQSLNRLFPLVNPSMSCFSPALFVGVCGEFWAPWVGVTALSEKTMWLLGSVTLSQAGQGAAVRCEKVLILESDFPGLQSWLS